MSKTTEAVRLFDDVFLVPINGGVFSGAPDRLFFHVIKLPREVLAALGIKRGKAYSGKFYTFTNDVVKLGRAAVTTHPLTDETFTAVLQLIVDPRALRASGQGYGRKIAWTIGVLDDSGDNYLYQFTYDTKAPERAFYDFLADQGDLLTLPGAV